MAGVQGSALAIAVCRAGAIGSLPCAMLSPDTLRQELTAITAATDRPYNVNFFAHMAPPADLEADAKWQARLADFYAEWGVTENDVPRGPGRVPFDAASADVLEAFAPAVVSFHFGLPCPELFARVKRWGSQVWSSATTVEEGLWLQAHGADAVIAQGLEAGGHRGHFLSVDLNLQPKTLELVRELAPRLHIPVIAAGGITDAESVRAALGLGAKAVQAGTAFLLCPEATTSTVHRMALQSPESGQTALTNVFTGRPARGIINRAIKELGAINPLAPAFPRATHAMAPLRQRAEARGIADFSPLWAGENFKQCRAEAAADVVARLAQGLPE